MPKNDPTTAFHDLYLDAIKQLASREHIFATAAVLQLKASGIADADKHRETIHRSFAEALANPDNAPEVIAIKVGDPRIDELNAHFSVDDTALSAAVASITGSAEKMADDLLRELRARHLKDVLHKPDERLVHLENDRQAFTQRLALTWKKPLQLLDLHIALILELGGAWSRKLRRGKRKDAKLVEVLTRLHARSLQVAGEVRALLREGFADGALSRWRTIHELAVVALFVAQEGNEMAERYLAHLDVDSYKAALGYDRAAPLLNYQRLSPKQLVALTKKVDGLKRKYGKAFAEDYGWAASSLKGQAPTFANIEQAVNLERFRPYFRLASNTLHAGPKGAYFRLGAYDSNILLAGASNVGLQEAARLTALSLAQITSCLLYQNPNLDSGVWTGVLLDLSDMVEREAVRVMRRIEREERQLRNGRVVRPSASDFRA